MAMVAGIVMTTEKELLLFIADRLPNRFQRLLQRLRVVAKKTD